jgi:2'-deoxynucleoside 5'-phosphate N-hydrolase
MFHSAYVSGVLTGASDLDGLKAFYEAIAQVCAQAGIDAYVPHRVTDPVRNADLTPRQVYELDRIKVAAADLIIAYVGFPSLGVGMEIEIARQHNRPVLLLVEKDTRISRMARGNPAVIAEIRFTDFPDALRQLAGWLATADHGRLTTGD